MKEIQLFEFEIRAERDDERGHFLTGRPVVYGERIQYSWFDEIIEPGALASTDLKDVRFLVNHNTSMIPLARSRNNNANSTMQLRPDDIGMAIRVDLDTDNNSEAKSLYSAVYRGDITGMSFMFAVDEDAWEGVDDERPLRRIKSISRIMEVSAVTFPAYSQTSIQTRGLSDTLESARKSLESAKKAKREKERKRKQIKILLEM